MESKGDHCGSFYYWLGGIAQVIAPSQQQGVNILIASRNCVSGQSLADTCGGQFMEGCDALRTDERSQPTG